MKRIANFLTGRRSASVVLLVCIVVVGLALAFAPRAATGALTNPATSGDSQRVAHWQAGVRSADLTTGILVWSRTDGSALGAADRAAIDLRVHSVAALSAMPKTAWPQLSTDRKLILAIVPVETSAALADASAVSDSLTSTARSGLPAGIRVRLTGDLASLAANAAAAREANGPIGILWLVLLSIVVLILVSRSWLLWILPTVLAIGSGVTAALVSRYIGSAIGVPSDSVDTPLLLAVGVGVATAAAAVLVLRLRAERHRIPDGVTAVSVAWQKVAPAIAASALILALGALVFLTSTSSRVQALGLASAFTIVLVSIAMLVAVPAGLAVVERLASRMRAPASGGSPAAARFPQRRSLLFAFVASLVIVGVAAGVTLALGAAGAGPADPAATQARALIDRSYTPGYGNEAIMIVPSALKGETSVIAPTTLAMNLPNAHSVTVGPSRAGRTELITYFDIDQGSADAYSTIRSLRGLIASTDGPTATSLVGGSDAAAIDRASAREATLALSLPAAIILCALLVFLADLWERRRFRTSEH